MTQRPFRKVYKNGRGRFSRHLPRLVLEIRRLQALQANLPAKLAALLSCTRLYNGVHNMCLTPNIFNRWDDTVSEYVEEMVATGHITARELCLLCEIHDERPPLPLSFAKALEHLMDAVIVMNI